MISIRPDRIRQIVKFFSDHPDFFPFSFSDPQGLYPPPNHPLALEFFFTMSKHQFGFWFDDGRQYLHPLWADVDGVPLKGSDFIWRMGKRMMDETPEFFSPSFQKNLTADRLNDLWKSDCGICPLPNALLHLALLNGYGEDMERLGPTPAAMVERARRTNSACTFLSDTLSRVRGYAEDPLRKKINMLLMILQNRPEKFLPKEDIPPIVDYHVMRLSLRTGIVSVDSPDLAARLLRREFVTAAEETAIRRNVFDAIERIKKEAGVGTAEIDWLFFSGRKWCPEMETPNCPACQLSPYCEKRTDLFQPVFRTTAY